MARTKTLVLVALSILLLPACIVVRDSPAPGCVERIGIPLTVGGCFGKTAILDLVVEPPIKCLSVTVNNCNGGVLWVRNNCSETLTLGGVSIAPQSSATLDVALEGGRYVLVYAGGNFSTYVPAVDERIEITGTLGERSLRVSFTKTAKLCE